MTVLQGKGVCGGIAFGKVYFYKNDLQKSDKYQVKNTEEEIVRFRRASKKAIADLEELYYKALRETGEETAPIFQIHQMMLEDDDYCNSIETIIRTQSVNAEYAVEVTGDNFAKTFSEMDDTYMKSRAVDVKDISERLIAALSGRKKEFTLPDFPIILAANNLVPSETIQLDKSKIMAFAMVNGSENSHTAILARTMNIPAVIGIGEKLQPKYDGVDVIVDGFQGKIYLGPDAETAEAYKKRLDQENKKKKLMKLLKGKDNVTLDGQQIQIYANIGNLEDVGEVLTNDADGIGLFRSEFLYLKSSTYPTEDEQFSAYKAVAESMSGKQVIIRTMDIGADKQVNYFKLPKEENPAMGYRAIRICLTQVDIFRTQLRALYRASAFGKIAIMFPMITSVKEIIQIKEIVNGVKKELDDENYIYADDVPLGIMIETPAAAMVSDLLAKEVNFFSIGTNDLTQFSLAIDRQNESLSKFYNPHHLAILRFIKMIVDNAHKNGIWAGICGELGSDLELTETFLALGVDELSVAPSAVLKVRKKIRETNTAQIKDKILDELK